MTVGLDGQRHAGVARLTVDQHGAGAAFAALATRLGGGEPEVLAQDEEQRPARLDVQALDLAVDGEGDGALRIGGGDVRWGGCATAPARWAAETTPMAPVLTDVRNPRRLTPAA